ncbi:MAG TPA: cation diffusion facilitator family transporter [Acidimicrobiales bacterium]|nr:cation diffusion facilitator family transporter [Acidimicrobiales bacterium]
MTDHKAVDHPVPPTAGDRRGVDSPAASTSDGDGGHSPAGGGHDDHGHGGHAHGVGGNADVRYLAVALGLISAFMVGEVVAAISSGSLALLADAGHMLTDVAALAASVWAAHLAARPAGGRWTYGLKRAEILSAAGNGVTLAVIGAVITIEGIRRLITPPGVEGAVVLGVALAGAVVNVAATAVLARANRTSLNVKGAFAHIVTDLYAFLGTAAAGLVILLTGWARADAVASLLVAALMAHAAWGLLRDAGRILLQAAPDDVSLQEVRAHIAGVEHVLGVHDLHVWTLTSNLPTLSAHVVVEDHCFASGHAPQILDSLQDCLGHHFDVEHSTFQLEPASHAAHEPGQHA